MSAGLIQGSLDARLQAYDEAAVVFELVLGAEDLRLWRVHQRYVGFETPQQFVAHGALLGTGGEQVDDSIELRLVVEQQMTTRKLNGIARHVRRDERLAVAVASDPGSEAEHLRQFVGLDMEVVGGAKGF